MTTSVAHRRCRVRVLAVVTAGLGTIVVSPMAAQAAPGPISAVDRDFLAKAHATTAFAISASELAERRGEAAVKIIGRKIVAQDRRLDTQVRDAATKLQATLPAAPAAELAQLEAAQAERFDAAYVDRVRTVDGSLLQLAAAVRVGTRNGIVRELAQSTSTIMMAQLPMLEGSGLFDFAALPAATLPAGPSTAARKGPNPDPGLLAGARTGDGFLWPSVRNAVVVLAVAALATLIAARRLVSRSGRARSRRG